MDIPFPYTHTYTIPDDVWVQSPPTRSTTEHANVEPDLVAALVPHAASPESLRLLDFVYQRLPLNHPRVTVLCLSTCHLPLPDGVDAALPTFAHVRLPGGRTFDVNQAVHTALCSVERVSVCPTEVYTGEHSWRVQVAALARAQPTTPVRVLPVLIRRYTPALAQTVCKVLRHAAKGTGASRVILVSNTDLLHCGADRMGWSPCPPSPTATDQRTMRAVVKAIHTRRTRIRSSFSLPLTDTSSACGMAVVRTFVAVAQKHQPHWRLAHIRYACSCTLSCELNRRSRARHHVGYPCITLRDPRRWRVPLARLPRLLAERHLFMHCTGRRVSALTLQRLARTYRARLARPVCYPVRV